MATFLVALATVPGGPSIATAVLVVAAVLLAVATFAPAIPGARRLPLIGSRGAKLTVEFDANDPACAQDRRDHPTQPDFQLRLRATNTGAVALTNVRCRLKARHDTYARIRYDDNPPYDRSHRGIELQPGARDYFDIAFCHLRATQMVLQYANLYLLQEQTINRTPKTARTPVQVTFEARREDTNEWLPPIIKRYTVVPDGDAITLIEDDSPLGGSGQLPPLSSEQSSDRSRDLRIRLNDHRRHGAEYVKANPPDEALARGWSDEVVRFLYDEGWSSDDVGQFQNAGLGTAADRLQPRVDVLGRFVARLDREIAGGPTEDRQVRMEPNAVEPADAEEED